MTSAEQPWLGAPDLPADPVPPEADSGDLSDRLGGFLQSFYDASMEAYQEPASEGLDLTSKAPLVADPADDFLARADQIHAVADRVYADAEALGADDLGIKAAVVYTLLALAEAVVRRDNAMASGALAMIAAKHYTASTGAADSGRLAGRMLSGDRDAIEGAMRAAVERYFVRKRKVGRNDPCVCGSGRKFKRCCGFAGRVA